MAFPGRLLTISIAFPQITVNGTFNVLRLIAQASTLAWQHVCGCAPTHEFIFYPLVVLCPASSLFLSSQPSAVCHLSACAHPLRRKASNQMLGNARIEHRGTGGL